MKDGFQRTFLSARTRNLKKAFRTDWSYRKCDKFALNLILHYFQYFKNSHFQEHTAQKNKFSVIDFVVNLNKSVWDGGFIQIY